MIIVQYAHVLNALSSSKLLPIRKGTKLQNIAASGKCRTYFFIIADTIILTGQLNPRDRTTENLVTTQITH